MNAYLEHYPEHGGPAEKVPIAASPFVIGRSRDASLTIYSQKVSKEHAVITRGDDGLFVKDLASTNGTFVNGRRVMEAPLQHGDILHVAHWEFCVCTDVEWTDESPNSALRTKGSTRFSDARVSMIHTHRFLQQLVVERAAVIVFQPILDLRTGAIVGFEALGRGSHHRLHQSPLKLFELAEKFEMANDLCRVFRALALREADALPPHHRLFLNIHPSEFSRPDFVRLLAELSGQNGRQRQLVIEVSEQSVTNVQQMRSLQRHLADAGIEFAYDDFGAGQARLLELAECPPHFLKLDRAVVQGMEHSAASRELVQALLSVIRGKGIRVIAEGVETVEQARLCYECGCDLAQGFLYGLPGPAAGFNEAAQPPANGTVHNRPVLGGRAS
jgi:EAL domain-containing protein (putative c-di-GMP-specific phosphodiesterase class I)